MSLKSALVASSAAVCTLFTPMAFAGEVRLAIIESLTGSPAFIGTGLTDGALLTIEKINAKGLAGEGVTITYTLDDDAGDRGQALGQIVRPDNL